MTTDIIFILMLIGIAMLGAFLGFGRSLKITTKGIFGIIISIVACVMLGGVVKSIPAVRGFIENIDTYFAGLWSFLGKIYFGTVVYYICFFVVAQILRIVIVKIICKVSSVDKKTVKVVNKAAGAVFLSCFVFALCLLGLAGLKVFESSEFVVDALSKMENSFLLTLYQHNPIVL